MKNFITLLIFTCISIIPYSSFAQKVFSEGIIKYDVFVNNESKASGIYLISVKSGNIRRELAMNNGYSNVTIFNFKTGKTYSLNLDTETKYALEMSPEEWKEKNQRYANATLTPNQKTKTISKYDCESMLVDYGDQEKIEIYYTKNLVPQSESFNAMFPGLVGIPLEYEVKLQNKALKFAATMVDIKVIDSQIFSIPADYKIVTKSELEKIK